ILVDRKTLLVERVRPRVFRLQNELHHVGDHLEILTGCGLPMLRLLAREKRVLGRFHLVDRGTELRDHALLHGHETLDHVLSELAAPRRRVGRGVRDVLVERGVLLDRREERPRLAEDVVAEPPDRDDNQADDDEDGDRDLLHHISCWRGSDLFSTETAPLGTGLDLSPARPVLWKTDLTPSERQDTPS